MLVDSSNSTIFSVVAGAIRQASEATGASFRYLLATAQVESGLNPQAGAATSSARGLFQFIQQTWLATMKQAGAALGYAQYADAITKSPSGHYEVRDPTIRHEILKLREDPTANAAMAGALTKANATVLSARLGRAPSEGELYAAHFLGAAGAARLIALAAANPNAKAADFFANAAQANSSIFYDQKTGAARTVAQVRNILTTRYDVARNSQPPAAPVAQAPAAPVAQAAPAVFSTAPSTAATSAAPAAPAASAIPDTAGITGAFAAAGNKQAAVDTRTFLSLFADADRNAPTAPAAPLAPLASALWGVPNGRAAQASATGTSFFDLFKDPPDKS